MATTVDTRRDTVFLIGSDKVEGTAVYGADDGKIASVQAEGEIGRPIPSASEGLE